MYINNEDFEKWMQKLSKKLSEIGQDLKLHIPEHTRSLSGSLLGYKTIP